MGLFIIGIFRVSRYGRLIRLPVPSPPCSLFSPIPSFPSLPTYAFPSIPNPNPTPPSLFLTLSFLSPLSLPLITARGLGSAIAPQRVRAEPGRQTHFGAIHSPKFANLLPFHPHAQRGPCNILWLFSGMHILCLLHEYLHTRCSHKEIVIPAPMWNVKSSIFKLHDLRSVISLVLISILHIIISNFWGRIFIWVGLAYPSLW